jgi:tetratricopeptide (TPR) repeat protein
MKGGGVMRLGFLISLLLCLTLSVTWRSTAVSADKEPAPQIRAVLQLSPSDTTSIPAKTIIDICDKAVQDGDKLPKDTLAQIYRRRATAYIALSDFESAKKDLEKVLSIKPGLVDVRCDRARMLASMGQVNEARRELEAITRDDPKYAPAYEVLAVWFMMNSDFERGIEFASKAIALDKNLYGAYYNRTIAYLMVNKYSKALEDITRVLHCPTAIPENRYFLRARALNALGRHSEALEMLATARYVNPSALTAVEQFWQCHWGLGNYPVSEVVATELLDLEKKDDACWCRAACSLLAVGKAEEAENHAKQAISLAPKNAEPLVVRAEINIARENYEAARRDLERAVGLEPKNRAASAALAAFLACCPDEKFRNGEKALKLAKTLSDEIEDRLAPLLMVRAAALAEHGEYDEAVKCANEAVSLLDPFSKMKTEYAEIAKLFEQKRPFRSNKLYRFLLFPQR